MSPSRETPRPEPSAAVANEPSSPEVESILALLAAQVGEPWEAVDRRQVASAIKRHRNLAAAMRKVPLANGDEPSLTFAPLYEGERVAGGDR